MKLTPLIVDANLMIMCQHFLLYLLFERCHDVHTNIYSNGIQMK